MGSSGALSTSNQYIKYRIDVTINSQSQAGNYSNVTVNVLFWRTNTGYTTSGSGTVSVRINGGVYSAPVNSSQGITNSGIYLYSGNFNVGHDSAGNHLLQTSAWISLNTPLSSSEQGYNEWMPNIPPPVAAESPTPTTPTLSTRDTVPGQVITIGTTNTAYSGNSHYIWYKFGDGPTGWIAGPVGATYTNWTVPAAWSANLEEGQEDSLIIGVDTHGSAGYKGTRWIAGKISKPISVPSVSSRPTLTIDTSSALSWQNIKLPSMLVEADTQYRLSFKINSQDSANLPSAVRAVVKRNGSSAALADVTLSARGTAELASKGMQLHEVFFNAGPITNGADMATVELHFANGKVFKVQSLALQRWQEQAFARKTQAYLSGWVYGQQILIDSINVGSVDLAGEGSFTISSDSKRLVCQQSGIYSMSANVMLAGVSMNPHRKYLELRHWNDDSFNSPAAVYRYPMRFEDFIPMNVSRIFLKKGQSLSFAGYNSDANNSYFPGDQAKLELQLIFALPN